MRDMVTTSTSYLSDKNLMVKGNDICMIDLLNTHYYHNTDSLYLTSHALCIVASYVRLAYY